MVEVTGNAAELGRVTLEERWASVTGTSAAPFVPRSAKGDAMIRFVRTFRKPDSTAILA